MSAFWRYLGGRDEVTRFLLFLEGFRVTCKYEGGCFSCSRPPKT